MNQQTWADSLRPILSAKENNQDFLQEAIAIAQSFEQNETLAKFIIGDVASLVKTQYGKSTIEELAKNVGYAASTIRGYMRVCDFWQANIRFEILEDAPLTYSHFEATTGYGKRIMKYAKDELGYDDIQAYDYGLRKATRLIERAGRKGYSVRSLNYFIARILKLAVGQNPTYGKIADFHAVVSPSQNIDYLSLFIQGDEGDTSELQLDEEYRIVVYRINE